VAGILEKHYKDHRKVKSKPLLEMFFLHLHLLSESENYESNSPQKTEKGQRAQTFVLFVPFLFFVVNCSHNCRPRAGSAVEL
jgi:hypothetical protein